MNIQLTHSFKQRCHDLAELLEGCNKLSTFCGRLDKQADKFPDRYDPNTYKGDGFEFFVEGLLKLFPAMWVSDYCPIRKGDQDYGVDGFGVGMDEMPATVQCKYRSNNDTLLLERDLGQFAYQSQNRYKVPMHCTHNMWVVTTAKDLHYFTKDEMLLGKVQCIGHAQLRDLVDKNNLFWNQLRTLAVEA